MALNILSSFNLKMRSLYDWVIKWAESPYASWALFILALAESSFFPIPPDVLLIAMIIACRKKAFFYALICSAGSILGGVIGYLIGYGAWEVVGEPIVQFYSGEAYIEKIKILYDTYGFYGILIAAVTPIPYKVFTITSGLLKYNFFQFFIATIIGRPLRFFTVALLLYLFGEKIKNFIDKYFNILTIVFTILLVGGFVILKWIS